MGGYFEVTKFSSILENSHSQRPQVCFSPYQVFDYFTAAKNSMIKYTFMGCLRKSTKKEARVHYHKFLDGCLN